LLEKGYYDKIFFMNVIPIPLLTAVLVNFVCQIFKFIYYSIKDGKISFHYMVTPGGMPSAHSAFVTSVTTTVAIRNGIGSDIFAVCAVFALIVIYDSVRLRGVVQKQSILLNQLNQQVNPDTKEKLSEMVGHNAQEIVAGIVLGGLLAVPISLYFLPWVLKLFV
jgi:acid phosphatase family membrane protein YuiD